MPAKLDQSGRRGWAEYGTAGAAWGIGRRKVGGGGRAEKGQLPFAHEDTVVLALIDDVVSFLGSRSSFSMVRSTWSAVSPVGGPMRKSLMLSGALSLVAAALPAQTVRWNDRPPTASWQDEAPRVRVYFEGGRAVSYG